MFVCERERARACTRMQCRLPEFKGNLKEVPVNCNVEGHALSHDVIKLGEGLSGDLSSQV